MKLKLVLGSSVTLAALSLGLSLVLGTGCAPSAGAGARAAHSPSAASTPQDVLEQMNAELANAIVGTTTTTSASMELPESRMPLAETREAEAPAAPAQPTWGVTPEPPRPIETQSPYAQ